VTGTLHVVGAGVAGLAAALKAARAGRRVVLHEATGQAGGRARTVTPADGFHHDNGTHVLLTANRRALALITSSGARDAWIEPEPDGLPVYDARNGRLARVGLSPTSWLKPSLRPEGLGLADVLRLGAMALPGRDRPILAAIGPRPIMDSLVEPLTVAVLNTPVAVASAKRLGRALRRVAMPGGARLLVAVNGLGPDLIAPALEALRRTGAEIRTGARLRAIEVENGRAVALAFGPERVALAPRDAVVLALPPAEVKRLLPSLPVPDAFEPIINAHFQVRGPQRPRFVGLRGALSQWALARPDHVSVTVSAAGEAADEDPDVLLARIWSEIAPAFAAAGVAIERHGEARVVKEKRATIRQAAGPLPQPPVRPLANLALAGDWLGDLPATIESAVMAGEKAAGLV
jgi:phytoene dehydrogenase-like protein